MFEDKEAIMKNELVPVSYRSSIAFLFTFQQPAGVAFERCFSSLKCIWLLIGKEKSQFEQLLLIRFCFLSFFPFSVHSWLDTCSVYNFSLTN